MTRVTLDKIVDAKYRYLDANKSLPGVVEISQTFANTMAEELLRDMGRRVRSTIHCRVYGDCYLFGMKVEINPYLDVDVLCSKAPSASRRKDPWEDFFTFDKEKFEDVYREAFNRMRGRCNDFAWRCWCP